MVSRDEAEQALTGLGAAHDRIAAAMYALDVHPGLALLRRGTLGGQTESRWRALRPEVDLLWAHFAALSDVLEHARAIRGGPELETLLSDPVVGLGPDGMPADQTAVPATRVTIAELARQLEQRCGGVVTLLSEVDAAWTAAAAAFVRASESVDAVVALAAQVGEDRSGAALRAELAEVERLYLGDPLAAAPTGRLTDAAQTRLTKLTEAAGRARQELDGLVRLRAGYPQRRAALTALLDEVAAVEHAVARTHVRVAEKIAEPGLGAVPDAATALRGRLEALDGRAERGEWRSLASDISIVEDSARRARDRARELTTIAEGLLARRDELRGRLEAYRAKAVARGLAEHGDLATLYGHAHNLLFTAPCDLRASTRAVSAYQHTLASVLGSGERSAVDD